MTVGYVHFPLARNYRDYNQHLHAVLYTSPQDTHILGAVFAKQPFVRNACNVEMVQLALVSCNSPHPSSPFFRACRCDTAKRLQPLVASHTAEIFIYVFVERTQMHRARTECRHYEAISETALSTDKVVRRLQINDGNLMPLQSLTPARGRRWAACGRPI